MITTERTRVRMLETVCGLAMPKYDILHNFDFMRGQATDLHPDLAEAWVKCGHAELLKEEKKGK